MSDDNLTAVRWIVYLSVFGASLWRLWDGYHYWTPLLVSAFVSFIGGGVIMIAVEVAFNSDTGKTPVQKVFIFFSVLAVLSMILWGGGGGDYYRY